MNISAELPNYRHTEEENGGEFAIEYAHDTDNDDNETERQTRNSMRILCNARILCAFYVTLALSATILLVCLLIKESTT